MAFAIELETRAALAGVKGRHVVGQHAVQEAHPVASRHAHQAAVAEIAPGCARPTDCLEELTHLGRE